MLFRGLRPSAMKMENDDGDDVAMLTFTALPVTRTTVSYLLLCEHLVCQCPVTYRNYHVAVLLPY